MRFKIHLQTRNRKAFLPVDYQYAMASAIYKLIARGDEAYSQFLHDKGFSAGGLKCFRLFTFSPLTLPRYTQWKEKGLFELHERALSFTVSFMADKAAEAFVKGMFHNQHLTVGDRFQQVDMDVTMIEAMQAPLFINTMYYRCLSSLTIGCREAGKVQETYLPPDDPRFEELFLQNLISKCAALNILNNNGGVQKETLKFQLEGAYRSKLIAIKPYTNEATKVKGFVFDFSLTAPEYMQEMGYYAGFGMNNAMGFGCGEVKA